jgi:hypothetical protein
MEDTLAKGMPALRFPGLVITKAGRFDSPRESTGRSQKFGEGCAEEEWNF